MLLFFERLLVYQMICLGAVRRGLFEPSFYIDWAWYEPCHNAAALARDGAIAKVRMHWHSDFLFHLTTSDAGLLPAGLSAAPSSGQS